MGSKDDELYIRWVQYGLYSPIMRLHSTSNEFMGKEPWKHEYTAEQLATDCLRQRHALLPYLYSMNYRTHKHCLAICEPMYYAYPEEKAAYEVRNQYFFGSELMVAPITSRKNEKTNLSEVDVWLPEGRWTDIYTGAIYQGPARFKMYRGIESIPVFAKEGAIIPMSADDRNNDSSNPEDMIVRIYRGKNTFELYEDDGETNDFKKGNFAITRYSVNELQKQLTFKVSAADGDASTLPEKRNYTFIFEDVADFESISVNISGKKKNVKAEKCGGKVYVKLDSITPVDTVEILLSDITARQNGDKKEKIIELVTKYQLDVNYKKLKFNHLVYDPAAEVYSCDECFAGPIREVQKMV